MPDDLLLTHLRSLDSVALAALLRARPDATRPPEPTSLPQLAQRLASPGSVDTALRTLPQPALGVLEVLQYLGARGTRQALHDLVLLDGPHEEAALETTLAGLLERALVIEHDGRLELVEHLRTGFANPLGRGLPVADLLEPLPREWTDHVLRTLALPRAKNHALGRAAVARALNPDRVRHLLQTGPRASVAAAVEMVREGGIVDTPTGSPFLFIPGPWRSASPLNWLTDHGLVVPTLASTLHVSRELFDVLVEPPREVRLAWRRPEVATVPADEVPVARESSAAATAELALVTELLEELAARPCPALRTGMGGLGVREVRRLAKLLRCAEPALTTAAQLADVAGLVAVGEQVGVTEDYPGWREQDPAERLVALLLAWWDEPAGVTCVPVQTKAVPLFVRPPLDPTVQRLRQGLLAAFAALPPGRGALDLASVLEHVSWEHPLALPPDVDDEVRRQAEAAVAEMEALGLVAHGRASALGRALVAGEPGPLRDAAAGALPAVADDVLLQADLTAVVTGSPSATLTALLDAMADREARGNASTWRFSPASVRRALDAGAAADDLLDRLAKVARVGLPQPLAYLVRDVARRHGQLAVAPVTCVVVGDDPALLAEVVAHRALRPLSPRLLAPTVLAAAKPAAETLRLLREAGYLPVEHDAHGQLVLTGRAAVPAGPRGKPATAGRTGAATPTAADVEALAVRLVAAPDALPAAPRGRGKKRSVDLAELADASDERRLLTLACRHLTDDEVAILEHAVTTGGEIEIDYVDQRGKRSERVISDCELDPPYLEAWCHLRQDERAFMLARIQSVRLA